MVDLFSAAHFASVPSIHQTKSQTFHSVIFRVLWMRDDTKFTFKNYFLEAVTQTLPIYKQDIAFYRTTLWQHTRISIEFWSTAIFRKSAR